MAAKKKEALGTFENVTKNILQDEIEHGYREKIADLDHQYEDVKRQFQLTSAEVKARRLTLTDQYGSHLGKEFLDPFKLQDLSNILQQGRAAILARQSVFTRRMRGNIDFLRDHAANKSCPVCL